MTEKDNIVNLSEAKNKEKSNNESSAQKLTAGEIDRFIFQAVMKQERALLPSPRFEIGAFALRPGVKQLYYINCNDEAILTADLEYLRCQILEYTSTILVPHDKNYAFTSRRAQGAAEYIRDRIPIERKPPLFKFAEEDGLCLRRAPFTLLPNIEGIFTPRFNEMFSRIECNGQQLKAWIWSILVERNCQQQYVWLFGEGGDGKGTLIRILNRLLGQMCITSSVLPQDSNRFWAWSYENVRLIAFSDVKSGASVDSGPLKMLTGGDKLSIEPKGGKAYMADNIAKVIIASNYPPNQSGSTAELRRCLLVKFKKKEFSHDDGYEEELWQELPAFLDDCRLAYEQLCPTHGPIAMDDESREILAEDMEDRNPDLAEFFKNHLIESSSGVLFPHELTDRIIAIVGRKEASKFQSRFKKWLETKGYKIIRNKSTPREYRGISLRPINLVYTSIK